MNDNNKDGNSFRTHKAYLSTAQASSLTNFVWLTSILWNNYSLCNNLAHGLESWTREQRIRGSNPSRVMSYFHWWCN